jgi:hypothetical protein
VSGFPSNGPRPVYENAASLLNEKDIARAVASHRGYDKVVKLPAVSYGIDFAMLNDAPARLLDMIDGRKFPQVGALLEVKARDRLYDSMLISALKVQKAMAFSNAGLPVVFAWGAPVAGGSEWEIVLVEAARAVYYVLAGRTDRQDAADTEPMAVIDVTNADRFTALRGVKGTIA